VFQEPENQEWSPYHDPEGVYDQDDPYETRWDHPEEAAWENPGDGPPSQPYPDFEDSGSVGGFGSGNASGPVMVVLGAISGCIFLLIFLFTITASISYTSFTVASTAVANAQNSPALDKNDQVSNSDILKENCDVSGRFPEKVLQWCNLITFYAHKHDLSPDLIAALIWQESGGNASAYSRSGAVGLMQVMPRDGLAASFMCVNGPCFSARPTTKQLQDPEFNISYGTRFLAQQVKRNGTLREALKSYGPMDVGYYYADKVLNIFRQYRQQ
jgi:soluble lytic murein transglycosylase-like protein